MQHRRSARFGKLRPARLASKHPKALFSLAEANRYYDLSPRQLDRVAVRLCEKVRKVGGPNQEAYYYWRDLKTVMEDQQGYDDDTGSFDKVDGDLSDALIVLAHYLRS